MSDGARRLGSGVLPISEGGTGATTAASARIKLGLSIGNNVAAGLGGHLLDLNILAVATGADQVMVSTGAGAWALESGATLRTSLGLAIGTNVQAFDEMLLDLAAVSVAANDGEMLVATGVGAWALESGATLRTTLGLGTGDSPTFTDQTLSGQQFKSVTNSITAGTTQTQAGATALTADINRVTTVANSGDGVKLPTAVVGAEVLIHSDDAGDALQVWPATGDKIDGGSANAVDPSELEAGGSRKYFAVDGTNWFTGTADNPRTLHIEHTATENDDHALEIDIDAAGFGDVKAIDIDYITGAISATELEAAIVVDFDGTGASAGIAVGLEVVTTRGGLDNVFGLLIGTDVSPIIHLSGTFADADTALNIAVNVQAAWADGGAGAITTFVADNDTITIGDAAEFEEIEFEIATPASGAGIAPTFEYSTGSGTWQLFSPTDGTNGFKNTGVVVWLASQVSSPAFVAGAGSKYRIRITRTRNGLATTPIIDEVQISADTEFSWNKTGDLRINTIELGADTDTTLARASAGNINIEGNIVYRAGGTDVPVADGGTGSSTAAAARIALGLEIGVDIQADLAVVSQVDAEAGTATDERVWTAERVKQAIAALETGSSLVSLGIANHDDITVSSAGEMTNTSQPAFQAYNSVTDSNVTGDDTDATVELDTEVFDQNNDFASNTFTAPVTGKYLLCYVVAFGGVATSHDFVEVAIVTSNNTFIASITHGDVREANTGAQQIFLSGSIVTEMDAADTATLRVDVKGGTKTVSVTGGARHTNFSGALLA